MIDKDLLAYIKGRRYYLFLIVLFSFLGLVASVTTTFFLSTSVMAFVDLDKDKGLVYLFSTIGFALLIVVFYLVKGKFASKLADHVSVKIRNDIYQKYVKLNGKSNLKIQEIAQLTSEGIEQLRLYYSSYLPSFFYAMIAPISLFILFCFFTFKAAIVYLVCVPLIPMSIILVSKWAKKIFATYWNRYLSLGGAYLDSVSGMKELLIFHYDEQMQKEMKDNSEEFRKITMKVLVMQLASTTIMDLVAYGGAAIGILVTLLCFKNSEINATMTLFMILVGAEFFLPMRSLGSAFHIAMNGATAGKKVITMLKEEPSKNGDVKITSISSITLKDVLFSYPDGDKPVLKKLDMRFQKGMTSILGDSGCGKSTLAKILCRKLDGYTGEILVDENPLSDLDIYSYREHVSYLSIDSYLLHLSIRDAFRFYNPNIEDDRILELLEKVSLKERILDEGGLDYLPKEGASDLSGGEKQRLLLAYYLGVERDFYLFDETTSNIDRESEEIILSLIRDLAKNHIVVFISHRLNNALKADYIYYLGEGGILEEGKPDELVSQQGKFYLGITNENKWEAIL
jgi:ATP-binding cassette, subfamily C, bacterial